MVGGAPGTAGSWRNKRAGGPEIQWGQPWAWHLGGVDNAGGDARAAGQPGRVSGGDV